MNTKTPPPAQRLFVTLILGFGLFILAICVVVIGFHISYLDRIYPGVRVGWVDLSGMTVEEATTLLAAEIAYPQQGHLLLRDGEKSWVASPAQTGLFMGPEFNARAAFDYGRSGPALGRLSAQFDAWYQGVNLPVEMVFDQRIARQYLESLAAQVDIPTVEASLSVNGTDVVVNPGQIGRLVDVAANLDLLETQVQTLLDGEIDLVVKESRPVILDVSEQAEIARQILSAPLVLTLPGAKEGDPGPWRFEPQELAGMLTIERVPTPDGETYQVGLNAKLLYSFLENIGPGLYVGRKNARFMFNDDTRQLEIVQPAVVGQSLDVEATLAAIKAGVFAGEHEIALDMEYTEPDVGDDATSESLGITELVSSHTTYFYGSGASRRQNIATAASRFYGVLVAPGETFSMAKILGDVSLDTGYEEAWIIFGDRTIKGVGGGVCQVSTTLFRTAFFGGYPILERYPHAYRVYYYERTYGGGSDPKWAGLDATVYVPLVDFKFQNDTDYWLLMETYVGDTYLTWKFYSTSDGRTVEWNTTGLTNIQDPPDPLYQENSDLAKGQIEQVDWAVEGADVTVTREVWRDGSVILSDVFNTHYVPWRAVCEYGSGTSGMPPQNPSRSNPCKPDRDNN
jgi:vancomycin resistance protein YoaR